MYDMYAMPGMFVGRQPHWLWMFWLGSTSEKNDTNREEKRSTEKKKHETGAQYRRQEAKNPKTMASVTPTEGQCHNDHTRSEYPPLHLSVSERNIRK